MTFKNRKVIKIKKENSNNNRKDYAKTYYFIKGFCVGLNLSQTEKALSLAEVLHKGQFRKGGAPYIIHPLKVCSTLISLEIKDDDLLASALLHDVVEDRSDKFPKGGVELVENYGFSFEVFDIVSLLTKNSGLNSDELDIYFNNIKTNPKALLIKLADRSHNSETIYIFTIPKLREYLSETRKWIFGLCNYGRNHYPEYSNEITILKSKISSLCDVTEILVNKIDEDK